MKIDVILPVYNEAKALGRFVASLAGRLDGMDADWLIHMVVDQSTDGTEAVVEELCRDEPRLRGLLLSTRFGHQESLLAGLCATRPDAAVLMMDSDGQHPPEVVPQMVDKLQGSVDVVLTRRVSNPSQPLVSRVLSSLFYRLMSRLSGIPLEAGMADFRLLSPRVADVLRDGFGEHTPFLRGLMSWVGFDFAVVEYDVTSRLDGTTKYTLKRRLRMARLAILAFSVGPLRLAAPVGGLLALSSVGYAIYWAISWLVGGGTLPPGWATLVVLVAFLGGVQLAFVGILGEYLANIYDEVKRRPRFVVRRAYNYDEGSYRPFG